MPRELAITTDNELKIRDALSGDEVVLYYRTPATTDRVGYQKSLVVREGNQVQMRIHEAKLEFGSAILTGIRRGDFLIDGVLLSSTPGEDGYRTDWKALIEAAAGDLLLILGHQVFEGSHPAVISAPVETEAGETAAPLAKSSPASANGARPRGGKNAPKAADPS